MSPPIITLTTDFGIRDPFVGMMKGVILGIQPKAVIVDITHDVPPQDILEGGFVLHAAARFFPERTIHLAVVDPGVGGPRKPLLVLTRDQAFLGPDNGIFSFIYRDNPKAKVFQMTEDRYFLKPSGGRTFQGRDLFAPVAAWLSRGIKPTQFGHPIRDYIRIDIPEARLRKEGIAGEVIHIDRFGNLITNITGEMVKDFLRKKNEKEASCVLSIRKDRIKGLHSFYVETPAGIPGILINSSNFLEIYTYSGNASVLLQAGRGDKVLFKT